MSVPHTIGFHTDMLKYTCICGLFPNYCQSSQSVTVCTQIRACLQLVCVGYLCLCVSLTEFIQFPEVDLLSLAVRQVSVKCGVHQSKPTNLGRL